MDLSGYVADYMSRDTFTTNVSQFRQDFEFGKVLDVPEFLIHYIEKLEPLLDLGKNLSVCSRGNSQQIIDTNSVHYSLNFQENWMNENSSTSVDETEADLQCTENLGPVFQGNNKLESEPNNYQVQWDKNKKASIRQKGYIMPCPDLTVIHSQAMEKKTCPKPKNIRNGNRQSKKIHKNLHKLKDTPVLDTLKEIIALNWRNIKSFQAYCDKVECTIQDSNCIFKAAVMYCKSGTSQAIHNIRWNILSENCDIEESDVCNVIESNKEYIGSFSDKILKDHLDDHFSITKQYS